MVRLPLTCLTSQCCCEWEGKCALCTVVFSECENRMSVQLCLSAVSKESVVIDVSDDIFLSKCLVVALPCRH